MTRNCVIELNELTKKYHDLTAVDRLKLKIYEGEVFGLLGPNGAGKSTTILMILGLTEPTSGEVKVNGINSIRHPIEVKKMVGYMPDHLGFYEDRSGFENLIYIACLNSIPEKEARLRGIQLLKEVGLYEAKDKKVGEYSKGMRQRLGLAEVLIKNPKIIILDEPTLGIDPEGVREFLDLIVTLSKEQGITVLLSSHHLHQVQQVCDRVGIFVKGKLLAEGNIQSLSQTLFEEAPLIIEAEVSGNNNGIPAEDFSMRLDQLREQLQNMEEVESFDFQNGRIIMGCHQDVSAEIARKTVEAGLDLNRLSTKEYGLDEIYHRYFEGGKI